MQININQCLLFEVDSKLVAIITKSHVEFARRQTNMVAQALSKSGHI